MNLPSKMKTAAVVTLDMKDDKFLIVTMTKEQCHISRDQKHIGNVIDGSFIPSKDFSITLSTVDLNRINAAYWALSKVIKSVEDTQYE